MTASELDTFTRHYLIAALWADGNDDSLAPSCPHDGCTMRKAATRGQWQCLECGTTCKQKWGFELSDFSEAALARAKADCERFQTEAAVPLVSAYLSPEYQAKRNHPDCGGAVEACAGHDFWLTRNGHGTGFWDRDMDEAVRDELTRIAKTYGECWLYVGDDGELHFQ